MPDLQNHVFVELNDRTLVWEGSMAFLPSRGEAVRFVDGPMATYRVVDVLHGVSYYPDGPQDRQDFYGKGVRLVVEPSPVEDGMHIRESSA
jgi:hypothetical protein